ncbi:siroheme synthase CysG [Methylocystis parvus]|uniref:Uroporphyrinogen-III C-methyltransferase n=1 Tax=Methylocystis parvus TaxID=134 RepID=A0A6B8M4A2_9HYPH|nr:siroheme synthase CysG [Methylocystis parvus]QGM98744.1 uroporphyrinogen-III C-methyltransferase [Methylocystis parvus]WBK00904.1 siroheme synthase CysG [Methylocystis parvus OBBP]
MTRKPDEVSSEIMQPLETLPVFFPLAGKRVVVIGGGEGAAWKVDLAAATGAQVDVFARDPCDKLLEIAAARANVALHQRAALASDFQGATLAFGATFDDAEAEMARKAADAARVALNLADRPAMSDFIMGAIVNRSPLVIGVSTGGASPVFAQAVRGRIESLVPATFAAWAKAAQDWRPQVLSSGLDFLARRDFWRRFTRLAFRDIERPPEQKDRDALLTEARDAGDAAQRGRVTLVGSGPGDPELLTLKGMRALAGADVVLFDDLVPASILDFARREATRINVGKRGYKPSVRQEEITALLVDLARVGKNVVRLKGGDPLIFGRANEEIAALREAGFDIEIVPGVTAACAGAAALGASLTSRETARRVQFITAHTKDGEFPEDFDWGALADRRATTAVYMGNRTLPALSRRLLEEGMAHDTPAFVIERASTPDERIIKGTIADLPGKVASETIVGPVMVLIGWALVEN